MTIAAGMVFTDGVVLGADTLVSATYKQYETKLWVHAKGVLNVAVTGAGNYVLLKLANEEIQRRITRGMSCDDVRRKVLEPVIAKLYAEHIDKAPDWQVMNGYDLAGC